jgi:hypothetical protein
MIRFGVSRAKLEALIDAESADWRARAASRSDKLALLGRWSDDFDAAEEKVGWSEVKIVYRRLQHNKCSYCERELDNDPDLPTLGAQEHDLEHFRPKAGTIPWRARKLYPNQAVAFRKGMGRRGGYYWLAFELWNWCVSCKRCNSQLKGNRFPISAAGSAGAEHANVADLNVAEMPLLIYPISDIDVDPADLIGFSGMTTHAKVGAGHGHERGKATIKFFLLNARGLVKQRAVWLRLVWPHLCDEAGGKADAAAVVDRWASSQKLPFAGCIRSFIRLARVDRAAATAVMLDVDQVLDGYL